MKRPPFAMVTTFLVFIMSNVTADPALASIWGRISSTVLTDNGWSIESNTTTDKGSLIASFLNSNQVIGRIEFLRQSHMPKPIGKSVLWGQRSLGQWIGKIFSGAPGDAKGMQLIFLNKKDSEALRLILMSKRNKNDFKKIEKIVEIINNILNKNGGDTIFLSFDKGMVSLGAGPGGVVYDVSKM